MKRYIKSSIYDSVPSAGRKYYKVDRSVDADEETELTNEFEVFGLTYLMSLTARARFADLLEKAGIFDVSVCSDKNGDIGIYAFASDHPVNITDEITYILERVRESY